MKDAMDKILSEAGLAGAVIALLILALVKLYLDNKKLHAKILQSKDDWRKELDALRERHEDRYRRAIDKMNSSFEQLSRMLDKLFDWWTRRR